MTRRTTKRPIIESKERVRERDRARRIVSFYAVRSIYTGPNYPSVTLRYDNRTRQNPDLTAYTGIGQ